MGNVLRIGAALAAGAVLAVGCGPSRVEVQALPPEVQALNDVYDAPTGTVPPQAMQQILELQQTLDLVSDARVVSRPLVGLRNRVQLGGLATDPATIPGKDRPLINASVTVTQTCVGWDPASTTPNPDDGTIEVFSQFVGSVLQRTILGTASSCRARADLPGSSTLNVFLDGTFSLFLQGPLPADESQAAYLMAWNGTIGTASAQAQTSFDFRVVPPQVEVRIPVADGDIIGSVGANEVTLRGANGTFGCSFTTFECGAL
jgi:hypothetical protein